jgi:hypothetical protein
MYGKSPGQQAQEDYTLAQLEAESALSETRFETGTEALRSKGIIKQYINEFKEDAAKSLAELNKKKRRTGIGRLVGGLIGTAVSLANPALGLAARAAIPAAGSLLGGAAAGGFKNVAVNLPDRVRDKLTFLKSTEKDAYQQAQEFEAAIKQDDVDFEQMQVLKSGTSFLGNLGTQAVLDNLKLSVPVGEGADAITKDVSLAEARKILGKDDYKFMEYLGDIMTLGTGGTPADTIGALSTKLTEAAKAAARDEVPQVISSAASTATTAPMTRFVEGIGYTDVPTMELSDVFDEAKSGLLNLNSEERELAMKGLEKLRGGRDNFSILDGALEGMLAFDSRYQFNNVQGYFEGAPDMVLDVYNNFLNVRPQILEAYNFDELIKAGL